MRADWQTVKLGDVVRVQGGYAFKSKDFSESGIPVIKIKNVRKRDIDLSDAAKVAESVAERASNFYVKKWDVLISMTGSGPNAPASIVGRVARHSGADDAFLINQRVGRFIVKDPSLIDQRFLYYVFSPDEMQFELLSIATGSANQVNISAKQIESVEIILPSSPEQKAIAHILGSLDDKIELNRQMNETLEAMAQALFKSWFVDFDPVIDNALVAGNTIPDVFAERAKQRAATKQGGSVSYQHLFPAEFEFTEEMGWIPQGWKGTKLSELLDVKYGKDHKKLASGNIPVYGSGGLMRHVDKSLRTGESILIPRKGTLSNLMFVDEEFWTVDTMFFSIPKLDHAAKYLFHCLKMLDLSSMNVGSAVPSMTTKVLNDLDVLRPDSGALEEFDRLASDFFKRRKALDNASQVLAKLRDTLLPKLLSGELRIPDGEKLIQEATT